MTIHGYELTSEWENSTCGKIAKAQKGGKRYFLKMYQTPVAPLRNGSLDAKTIAHNQELFDKFVARHKRVNSLIRPLAGEGGNIIIPNEEFMIENHYAEASEFVEGAVPKDELIGILSSLSSDTKKLLMKTAAGALSSVHSKGVIHSDLKLENLLLVRNRAGNYVAKMLDFDSSYPIDDKPEEIIGTIDYYSPELGAYGDAEDDSEEMAKFITEKTDIFSLGLIYHFYLAGVFPEAVSLTEKLQKKKDKGKVIYPWVVLNSGCELQISSKIKSPKYISLISDMLSLDPNDRPTASEVLRRLNAPDSADGEVILQEPWPEHGIVLDKAKITAADIAILEKTIEGSQNKYKVMFKNGKKQTFTKDELISKGYAKIAAPSGFADPWSEHNIEFDLDILKKRGFVSCEQKVMSGIKGYSFYRADSTSTFFKVEMLIAMKYAKKKVASVSVSEPVVTTPSSSDPWPEHKIVFDMDAIKAKGYVGFERKSMGGVNGYEFVRSNGTKQFIRVEMVIIQKMAKKV